jgi:hypothetical protein
VRSDPARDAEQRADEHAAGTGVYDKHYEEGVYECAGCGTPLYKSATKVRTDKPPSIRGAHVPCSVQEWLRVAGILRW